MTETLHHLRGSAGASFTKADACSCRAQMRPVVQNWSKQQQPTGTGFQA